MTSPMVVERLVKCFFVRVCFKLYSMENIEVREYPVLNSNISSSKLVLLVPFKLCPLKVVNVLSGHYGGVNHCAL